MPRIGQLAMIEGRWCWWTYTADGRLGWVALTPDELAEVFGDDGAPAPPAAPASSSGAGKAVADAVEALTRRALAAGLAGLLDGLPWPGAGAAAARLRFVAGSTGAGMASDDLAAALPLPAFMTDFGALHRFARSSARGSSAAAEAARRRVPADMLVTWDAFDDDEQDAIARAPAPRAAWSRWSGAVARLARRDGGGGGGNGPELDERDERRYRR